MSITEDTLMSYAFGHLSPEEEAVVGAHLGADPNDAATVSGYLDSLAALVMTLPPEPLADTGKAELLARVRNKLTREPTGEPTSADEAAPARPPVILPIPQSEDPGRPFPLRRYGWLGALAAAVVALLYLTVLSPTDPDARTAQALRDYQAQPGAVSYALEGAGPKPLGTLVQLQDGRVFVALDAPPAAEEVYQAWAIADAPVSLGTFSGRTFLSTAAVADGSTFGVTLEPPGGSEQPTTTPLALLEL